MALFNQISGVVLLCLLCRACCWRESSEFGRLQIEPAWPDMPKSFDQWTWGHYNEAYERVKAHLAEQGPLPRTKRDVSSTPNCPSAWAKQTAAADEATLSSASSSKADQFPASQRSVLDDYGYGPQAYPLGGLQHPNLAQFQRYQPTNSWIPSNPYVNQQFRSSGKHPVAALPDVIDTHAAVDFNGYRGAESPLKQVPSAEDIVKTTNGQYPGTDYYRQLQQALADGKQLSIGTPNIALSQQLAAASSGLAAQPVFTTPNFPVTSLSFDPEEMRKVYGQYYVPPIFSLVQKSPNSVNGAPDGVVRDVLQYLLTQYQNGGANGGFRNQRQYLGSPMPHLTMENEKVLHGLAPLQNLPRQSSPALPSFTGDNQLLPPNSYRSGKWEPATNLVVNKPVNLGEFEQYARSTPCSRQKRQMGDIWGYYPQLARNGAQGAEPLPMYPGLKSAYGPSLDSSQSRSAFGLDYPRQSMGYGQPLGLGGQQQSTMGPIGPMGPMQPFANQPYPDYYSNYQGRDAVSGLQQVISGFSQLMPMAAGSGLSPFR